MLRAIVVLRRWTIEYALEAYVALGWRDIRLGLRNAGNECVAQQSNRQGLLSV